MEAVDIREDTPPAPPRVWPVVGVAPPPPLPTRTEDGVAKGAGAASPPPKPFKKARVEKLSPSIPLVLLLLLLLPLLLLLLLNPPAPSPPPLAFTAAATAAAMARLSLKVPVHSPRDGSLRYWEEEKAWVGPAPVRTMMSSPLYSHTAAAAAWRAREAVARACREVFADLLQRVTMEV